LCSKNVLCSVIHSAKIETVKGGDIMAVKSSNVVARVEPEIKEKAEEILSSLGISASGGINMFYRQIILWNGLPFRPSIPTVGLRFQDELTKEELDTKLAKALAQAETGEGIPSDEFFSKLRQEVMRNDVKEI